MHHEPTANRREKLICNPANPLRAVSKKNMYACISVYSLCCSLLLYVGPSHGLQVWLPVLNFRTGTCNDLQTKVSQISMTKKCSISFQDSLLVYRARGRLQCGALAAM